jgi:HD-GYP domain-containing protein (c-di-GMP phosphodiesterase class II)
VHALTRRLAEKDEYTERHARRVALLAVQVGELLGLSARRLRALAIGGLVHDIGKLSIPDAILKKPGPLDDREFEAIRRHPDSGSRLLQELGGFSETVRRLVRDHHERLDGGGYPRGLTEGQLDLETRILTVCDVYDALISPRVYRPAWTHEEAVALLRRETGTAFDARCVAAIEQVLIREWADRGPVGSEHPASSLSARSV